MAFHGPEPADYDNVTSLNVAYLSLLGRDRRLIAGLADLPETLQQRLREPARAQVSRLAATPFLLFSFRESDDRYWNRILSDAPDRDLFAPRGSDELDTLVSAGLGFIWQLARRNPYALRLTCGAPLSWCERVAEVTFFHLLDSVAALGDIPVLRFAHHRDMWRKLLDSGVSRDGHVRHAAQMSALQVILTNPMSGDRQNWPLAARKLTAPALRVADER